VFKKGTPGKKKKRTRVPGGGAWKNRSATQGASCGVPAGGPKRDPKEGGVTIDGLDKKGESTAQWVSEAGGGKVQKGFREKGEGGACYTGEVRSRQSGDRDSSSRR